MDILLAFSNVYAATLARQDLSAQIQKVKEALYNRDYSEAFGKKEYLEAYVVRWSPSRALAYKWIFQHNDDINRCLSTPGCRVLCIGGGAGAELSALSAFPGCQVTTVDQGDWEPVVGVLAENLDVSSTMIHDNALSVSLPFGQFDMITCLFTANELFAQSKMQAVSLLRSLSNCKKGTLFVIIESAGSYSEIRIGNKKFPVQFLIHHTLTSKKNWTAIYETDSEWYRLDPFEKANYPLQLENMRYFMRVYQRT